MSLGKKLFVSLFILFNFLIMARVHVPLENSLVQGIYRPVDSYLSFFSTYQSWRMFSPNPSRVNAFLTAEIEFVDGSKTIYEYPRSSELPWADRYVNGERFRVITESIRKSENNFLWKDAAKFALRKIKDENFYKIPERVHLYRHWNNIPDVKDKFMPHLSRNSFYQSHKFYTHEVLL